MCGYKCLTGSILGQIETPTFDANYFQVTSGQRSHRVRGAGGNKIHSAQVLSDDVKRVNRSRGPFGFCRTHLLGCFPNRYPT